VTNPKPDHDALYHRFFSDPAIVAQLLREFVAGPWLDELDLDGMERLSTKFHADTGERRESDLVWRIPRRDGGDAYVMLLLEFQSTPDHWMALRMLVYAGLLWQQLVREQRLLPDGKLPPILPVVLYNGEPRWQAARVLRDLIGLPKTSPLWQWQPDLHYHLIDEGAFTPGDLEGRGGLPALLFRLENSPTPSQLVGLAGDVLTWFSGHPGFDAARKVLVELLQVAMEPLDPSVRVPEDLLEVRNMLVTRMEKWVEQQRLELDQRVNEAVHQAKEQLKQQAEKAEQRGQQKGEATLLLRLLERRFGALPDLARVRVLAADTDTLEEWGLRVLEAATLDEVLA
jgi:predicted transposase YdaD